MKCPNCNEEIKEGYLYCEKCGSDIHIVPDYEPELELSLMQSVYEILDEEEKEKEETQKKLLEKRKKIRRFITIILVLVFICIVFMFCYFGIQQIKRENGNSIQYQIKHANQLMESGEYTQALPYMERVVALNPTDTNHRLVLAKLYYALNMDEAYIGQLKTITDAEYASTKERSAAYEQMILFYIEKENYFLIHSLLMECNDDLLLEEYEDYVSLAPEFSYEEGIYEETIPLKLYGQENGNIYYSLDGSNPDINSAIYESPIFLEEGHHKICAVFINKYGISSEIITKEYDILSPKPPAPFVRLYSGEYQLPAFITVDAEEGHRIFYTTDGSYPSEHSTEYLYPIPLPLGKSYYKFVCYNEENVSGEVTSREYKLTLDTSVSPEEACQAVIDIMLQQGKIYNSLGDSYQKEGKYSYHFDYPLAVQGKGYYYVIIEVYREPSGLQTKTGMVFAVDIYSKEVFRLTSENGNYLLEGF